jgi:hypothetical protein
MKKTFVFLCTLLVCVWCSAQQTGGSQPAGGRIYKIGDTGPAGGIVFYDKGLVSDGWRYLEAAPTGTEFKAQWGPRDSKVAGTRAVIGSGKRNTQLIIAALGEAGQAAYLCANLNYNGHNDWFLPSSDELGLMYNSLTRMGLGSFHTGSYWSSSQDGNYINAWSQRFSDGDQNSNFKNYEFSVRAVRAF